MVFGEKSPKELEIRTLLGEHYRRDNGREAGFRTSAASHHPRPCDPPGGTVFPAVGAIPTHSPARSPRADSPEAIGADRATPATPGISARIGFTPLITPDHPKNAPESLAFAA